MQRVLLDLMSGSGIQHEQGRGLTNTTHCHDSRAQWLAAASGQRSSFAWRLLPDTN